jgi:hypothetical protein
VRHCTAYINLPRADCLAYTVQQASRRVRQNIGCFSAGLLFRTTAALLLWPVGTCNHTHIHTHTHTHTHIHNALPAGTSSSTHGETTQNFPRSKPALAPARRSCTSCPRAPTRVPLAPHWPGRALPCGPRPTSGLAGSGGCGCCLGRRWRPPCPTCGSSWPRLWWRSRRMRCAGCTLFLTAPRWGLGGAGGRSVCGVVPAYVAARHTCVAPM